MYLMKVENHLIEKINADIKKCIKIKKIPMCVPFDDPLSLFKAIISVDMTTFAVAIL